MFVFIVTFDQLNASFLNRNINFLNKTKHFQLPFNPAEWLQM